jgi:hypothetical protein
LLPVIVKLNACPCTGGFGDLVIPLIFGVPRFTVSVLPPEVRPVELFFTVTVKLPAARTACPDTCVLLPLALMLHGELHPGPLKKIVEFEPLKSEPVSVIVNAWPVIGGLGDVVSWLITGAEGGFDTVSDTPFDVSPVVLFFTVTVKLPAAKIACPDTCVLLPLALMLHGELHPGPLKNMVEFDEAKFDPVNVMLKACPLMGGFGEVVI